MLDWDDLRTFLAVSRHGNLSAAARATGVTQTTMGRRLETLHERVGVALLQRTPSGFVLTPAGERVLGNAERMEAEALAAERAVTGEDIRLEGLVRVTCVEAFGAQILAPMLAALQDQQPRIVVELDSDNRSLSLSRREADIAIRLARFEQHEAVVKKVGDMSFGIYASFAYLERAGLPDFSRGAGGHRTITLQEDMLSLPEAKWFADVTHAALPSMRSNSRYAQREAALSGSGLACLPRYLADGIQGLERIRPPNPAPQREIWLGVHRDTRHTARIRAVIDHLGDGLKREQKRLTPTEN